MTKASGAETRDETRWVEAARRGDRLVEIARAEKDPELKREAVQKLSVMGRNKEATDYLMELLKD